MANAINRTNMTCRSLTLCNISARSNKNYPSNSRETIVPSEGFLDVQTTVQPHRNKNRRQDKKESVNTQNFRPTASRCDGHSVVFSAARTLDDCKHSLMTATSAIVLSIITEAINQGAGTSVKLADRVSLARWPGPAGGFDMRISSAVGVTVSDLGPEACCSVAVCGGLVF
jgi:hypothetical protein